MPIRLALAPLLALAFGLLGCGRSPLTVLDEPLECVALARGLSTVEVSATVTLDRTDILLLMDNSGSMGEELRAIQEELADFLVPEIRERVSDPAFGVASFSDFGEVQLGERSHPYQLHQEVTQDLDAVLEALDRIKLEHGGDAVESQLEALYQVATGEGFGVYAEAHDCPPGTRAGVCFRDGSFGMVMLFTDAPMRGVTGIGQDGLPTGFHGFDPVEPLAPFVPRERTYEETLDVLLEEQIRVLGLWSGQTDNGKDDLRRVVHDTGAIDAAGQPILFDIGADGQRLGSGVVETLELLTGATRLNVGAWVEDTDEGDGVDAEALLTQVRVVTIDPADYGVVEAGGARALDVRPGAEVTFELTFDTRALPDSLTGTRFSARIGISADDGTLLTAEEVDLLVEAPGRHCQ